MIKSWWNQLPWRKVRPFVGVDFKNKQVRVYLHLGAANHVFEVRRFIEALVEPVNMCTTGSVIYYYNMSDDQLKTAVAHLNKYIELE